MFMDTGSRDTKPGAILSSRVPSRSASRIEPVIEDDDHEPSSNNQRLLEEPAYLDEEDDEDPLSPLGFEDEDDEEPGSPDSDDSLGEDEDDFELDLELDDETLFDDPPTSSSMTTSFDRDGHSPASPTSPTSTKVSHPGNNSPPHTSSPGPSSFASNSAFGSTSTTNFSPKPYSQPIPRANFPSNNRPNHNKRNSLYALDRYTPSAMVQENLLDESLPDDTALGPIMEDLEEKDDYRLLVTTRSRSGSQSRGAEEGHQRSLSSTSTTPPSRSMDDLSALFASQVNFDSRSSSSHNSTREREAPRDSHTRLEHPSLAHIRGDLGGYQGRRTTYSAPTPSPLSATAIPTMGRPKEPHNISAPVSPQVVSSKSMDEAHYDVRSRSRSVSREREPFVHYDTNSQTSGSGTTKPELRIYPPSPEPTRIRSHSERSSWHRRNASTEEPVSASWTSPGPSKSTSDDLSPALLSLPPANKRPLLGPRSRSSSVTRELKPLDLSLPVPLPSRRSTVSDTADLQHQHQHHHQPPHQQPRGITGPQDDRDRHVYDPKVDNPKPTFTPPAASAMEPDAVSPLTPLSASELPSPLADAFRRTEDAYWDLKRTLDTVSDSEDDGSRHSNYSAASSASVSGRKGERNDSLRVSQWSEDVVRVANQKEEEGDDKYGTFKPSNSRRRSVVIEEDRVFDEDDLESVSGTASASGFDEDGFPIFTNDERPSSRREVERDVASSRPSDHSAPRGGNNSAPFDEDAEHDSDEVLLPVLKKQGPITTEADLVPMEDIPEIEEEDIVPDRRYNSQTIHIPFSHTLATESDSDRTPTKSHFNIPPIMRSNSAPSGRETFSQLQRLHAPISPLRQSFSPSSASTVASQQSEPRSNSSPLAHSSTLASSSPTPPLTPNLAPAPAPIPPPRARPILTHLTPPTAAISRSLFAEILSATDHEGSSSSDYDSDRTIRPSDVYGRRHKVLFDPALEKLGPSAPLARIGEEMSTITAADINAATAGAGAGMKIPPPPYDTDSRPRPTRPARTRLIGEPAIRKSRMAVVEPPSPVSPLVSNQHAVGRTHGGPSLLGVGTGGVGSKLKRDRKLSGLRESVSFPVTPS